MSASPHRFFRTWRTSRGNGRGLERYEPRMNFPNPWRGGWWRLRDIVDYELTAAIAYFQAAAKHKTQLLLNSYRMNRDAVERGRTEAPYAFVVPTDGNDPWTTRVLLETLMLAGVEIQSAKEPFTADGRRYSAGSHVISMAQPLRSYAKDLLEAQVYPNRSLYPGGPPEPPYDEAGWTLPLKMGLEVVALSSPLDVPLERLTEAPRPKPTGLSECCSMRSSHRPLGDPRHQEAPSLSLPESASFRPSFSRRPRSASSCYSAPRSTRYTVAAKLWSRPSRRAAWGSSSFA